MCSMMRLYYVTTLLILANFWENLANSGYAVQYYVSVYGLYKRFLPNCFEKKIVVASFFFFIFLFIYLFCLSLSIWAVYINMFRKEFVFGITKMISRFRVPTRNNTAISIYWILFQQKQKLFNIFIRHTNTLILLLFTSILVCKHIFFFFLLSR